MPLCSAWDFDHVYNEIAELDDKVGERRRRKIIWNYIRIYQNNKLNSHIKKNDPQSIKNQMWLFLNINVQLIITLKRSIGLQIEIKTPITLEAPQPFYKPGWVISCTKQKNSFRVT